MTNRRNREVEVASQAYAVEKLEAAVYVLATHPSAIRWRLRAAAEHLLMVPGEALPDDLRRLFVGVLRRLTKHPGRPMTPGPSRIGLSVRGMHDTTATKLAQTIYRISAELESRID